MSLRPSATAGALATAAALVACVPADPPAAGRPWNVVLVVIDTLRADHLGTYGYERDTSPHLDAFARKGVVFERAQTSAPWTAPALISLVTSTHPDAHGVRSFPNPPRLGDAAMTLAEVLKRHGYATAAFTEGGYAKGDFGLDQGVDVFPSNLGDAESNSSNMLYPSRLAANLDRALDWLRDEASEPFFLLFHTYETHSPYQAPEAWLRRYRPDYDESAEHAVLLRAVERWNQEREVDAEEALVVQRHLHHCHPRSEPALDAPRAFAAALRQRGYSQTPEWRHAEREWIRDAYDAEIAYTDSQLQRLWHALSEQGLLDHTVVVVTSDHGEALGEYGRLGHGGTLSEEVLRVPLVLRAPDSRIAPGRVESLVSTLDVMPTVLELLEIAPDELALQGTSLVPIARGEPAAGSNERAVFSHGRNVDRELDARYSVRRGHWRLVVDHEADTVRLYDERSGTGETRNVAASHPKVVAELREAIERQRRRDRVLARRLGAGASTELSPELERELRALGYLE